MLKISSAQMTKMAEIMRTRFELAAVALLRREYPDLTQKYPDEHLQRFVAQGVESANAYGVVAVSDVEDWLRLMVRLGPGFDTNPRYGAIRQILMETELPPAYRLSQIADLLGAPP